MASSRSVISVLIPVSIVLTPAIVGFCYLITWENGDLTRSDNGGWFYISDLGNKPPQQYLFAIGFGLIALVLLAAVLTRFRQWHLELSTDEAELIGLNLAALIMGCLAFPSLLVVVAFNDVTFHAVHDAFAGICFGGLYFYQLLHCILCGVWISQPRRPRKHRSVAFVSPEGASVCWYACVFGINTIALLLLLSRTDATDIGQCEYAENVYVLISMLYFAPWTNDLAPATLHALRITSSSSS